MEGSGRGLISMYSPSIFMEGPKKTTETLSQYSWSPDRDLNEGAPEYEPGVLSARQRRSVFGQWRCVEGCQCSEDRISSVFRGRPKR